MTIELIIKRKDVRFDYIMDAIKAIYDEDEESEINDWLVWEKKNIVAVKHKTKWVATFKDDNQCNH